MDRDVDVLVTRAGDLALEIAAGLSVCLSVWAVRDVSTPWPTEEGVRRLLLIVAAGRLLSRGWLGGCEFSEPLRGPGSGRLRCHGDQRRRFLRAITGRWSGSGWIPPPDAVCRPEGLLVVRCLRCAD